MAETKMEIIYHEPPKKHSEKTGVIRACAYCRVSTLAEQQDLSYQTQCEYYEKLIAAMPNTVLVGVYGDEGFSGLHAKKRKQFMQMIEDCKAGKIDRVYTKSVSRFARNTRECLEYTSLLKELGIGVYFEKEHIDTETGENDLFFNIMASLAQEESNSLSQSQLWAKDRRNKHGDPARGACYGYRRERHRTAGIHRWIIEEEEAKRVREVFRLRLAGMSIQDISRRMQRLEEMWGGERKWSRTTIQHMLSNEAYVGDILTNKTYKPDLLSNRTMHNKGERMQYLIENHHEAIVSREDFARVQKAR